MNVHVHIQRLVLEGLTLGPGDAGRIRTAVEAELTRLVAAGSLAPHVLTGGAVPEVSAPPVALADPSPAAAGRDIARSVFGGIGEAYE